MRPQHGFGHAPGRRVASNFALCVTASFLISAAIAGDAMPVAQQNALVQKYCAVCHMDAHRNGGLSLEHFDAAHADPGLAAMMVGKLKGGAFGAAGIRPPDKETQDALQSALSAEAVGADQWTVLSKAPMLTASVVREVPSPEKANHGEPDVYRLVLTCREDVHEAQMQLAWAPAVPPSGREMFVAVDAKEPVTYKVEGTEKMSNGQAGTSGPGAILLTAPLPVKLLTVRNLFGDETVVFSFDNLTPAVRDSLSTCFAKID
jgi:hypothetical protein